MNTVNRFKKTVYEQKVEMDKTALCQTDKVIRFLMSPKCEPYLHMKLHGRTIQAAILMQRDVHW